ncbi:lantibiotic dehydratase [Streptomyces litchfieldiae]|uniref:Lantibiotic dehydratase n=1 Tax=Streptomyces litchfieldiae TaxID=3075543 RepID=A0ABU2MRU2_9ACTN|nr:lantibiotic dehydratase [Streptomyces sp. DSM 44938]MDT0343613.1 lantibiotic dehydratase [Streptomyces sp. DSM 44938]
MSGNERPAWRLVPRLLLRRAGFGFDLLEPVADARVLDRAAAYRAASHQYERARDELLHRQLPSAVAEARAAGDRKRLQELSALRSAAGRRRPVTVTAGVAGHAELGAAVAACARAWEGRAASAEALADAVLEEQAGRAGRLRGLLDSQVLDAMLQLAPSFFDRATRWAADQRDGTGARERAMMRRLHLYLQRFAAKNETTSFFGPLVHGLVDPERSGVRLGADTPGGVLRTRAFLSFWAVDALARRLADDRRVGPRVPVTWVAATRLEDGVLTLPAGRRVRLTPPLARLAARVNGSASAADLCEALGQSEGETDEQLAVLERLGAVRRWPEPSSTCVEPLEELLAFADRHATGTDWPARLRDLRSHVERYGAATGPVRRRAALAELEREFTDLADAPARRSGGRMYADRMTAYIDCEGDLGPVRLGGREAEWIARELSPVLDFDARYGEELHRAYQALAASVLDASGAGRMRYDTFVRRVGEAASTGGLAPYTSGAEKLRRELSELVRARLRGNEATLTPEELRELGTPDERPRFASPDVLLRQTSEGLTLVLGEVHPYVFAWGSQGLFCADPDGLLRDFEADLSPWGGRAAMATVLRRRAHKGLVTTAFPGRFVEVTARAGVGDDRRVAITDLWVERAADGRIVLRDRGGELVLYAGENDHPHLAAFAPPPTVRMPVVRFGDRAPRITVGKLIAQRARWWLPVTEIVRRGCTPSAADSFVRVQELRAVLGLPRWVYAHIGSEPKPICVDLDAPLAVEVLLSLAASAGEEPVTLVEMLPEPGALWLRKQNRPTTSELRLALIRTSA